ncbi:MAG: SDR family NAD-dependent epimerase/dehydratase [Planctomycetota bacterium]|nr:MAG: SDR family NAD-dependent epimerase/dehydratase [Planctomycetota bacterium]
MPRALVTGGAGFLGSHLCERLLDRGYEVVAMDNLLTGDMRNVEHLLDLPAFSLVQHDVSQYIHLPGELDAIFHFASPASPVDFARVPIQTMKVGSLGTHNCLGLALAKGARFLLASTSEVYGDPLEHPQKESYFGNVNPISTRGVYDEAKRFAESLTMAYNRFHGVETRIVRIFNTYGPRMRLDDGRVLPQFMRCALRGRPLTIHGEGTQTRSFCFVDDLIEGILRLFDSDHDLPTNIGNPREMTILEFAKHVQAIAGTELELEFKPLPEGDPKVRRPDISKAKQILDWEPQVPVEDGLRRALEFFQSRVSEMV